MRFRYYICDVFTDVRFGGNPLAVLPDATGLSDVQMQQIAREFNFSESTFVFPSAAGHTRKVRIFTPAIEVPFAGHPNIGTAFVLAKTGELGRDATATFEEKAGLVAITVRTLDGQIWCELAAPQRLSLGDTVPPEMVAAAVSLNVEDIVTNTHFPQPASVGLPFLIAEVKDRATLARARANIAWMEALTARGAVADIYLYAHSDDEFDIRARMFAPFDGVPEDPATGSASCALAGLLCAYSADANSNPQWRIAQGVEMGRPSVLVARAEKVNGAVVATWVAGTSVLVADGWIDVD